MGTRAFWGIKYDGKTKATYSHYDGDYEGLGIKVVEFYKTTSYREIVEIFLKITMVEEEDLMPAEFEEKYAELINKRVGESRRDEMVTWYQGLRGLQGRPEAYKDPGYEHMTTLRYIADEAQPLAEVMMNSDLEYGYIIDLDQDQLIVYKPSSRGVNIHHIKGSWVRENEPEEIFKMCENA